MTSRREFIEMAVKGVSGLTLVGLLAPNIVHATGCTEPNCPDCTVTCDVDCDILEDDLCVDLEVDDCADVEVDFCADTDIDLCADTEIDICDAEADPPCTEAEPDGCSTTVSDEWCTPTQAKDDSCQDVPVLPSDVDKHCGGYTNGEFDDDESCNISEGISMSEEDNSCNSGGNNANTDESCQIAFSEDENCYIVHGQTGAHDKDNACTATSTETDNSCGDCNDNHDIDEHCSVHSTEDTDELCGHEHAVGITTDNNCDVGIQDSGCGTHNNIFPGGANVDEDQNCTDTTTTADMNCDDRSTDEACNDIESPNTTSPDENCSQTDDDGACREIVDHDESCEATSSTTSEDESCGTDLYTVDEDEHCGFNNDPDQDCSHILTLDNS